MRSDRSVIGFLAFLSVILAFGIDASLPAFDELRSEFNLSDGSGEVSLVVTTYFLGMATGQLVWGLLSDRTGRRTALLGGLVLYAIGALGATLAPTMGTLLFARVVWGLGAAAPSVLRNSIARDLYSGDALARITSITMGIFLLGPAVAPAIGEGLLVLGSWRLAFAAGIPLSILGFIWVLRFGETLPPEDRRPLDARSIGRGARAFLTNRTSIGFSLVITLNSGAFFIYLGSSQPVIDEIYGLDEWFVIIFGLVALAIGATVLFSARIIPRHGAMRVGTIADIGMVITAGVFTVISLATDGRPPFAVWVVLITVFASLTTVSTPTFVALAMTPMAKVAGIASALNGVLTIGVASLLAAFFDRMIDDSVTPMAVGYLVYSFAGLLVLQWARGGSPDIVDPDRIEAVATA